MDNRTTLYKCISLLLREAETDSTHDNSRELVSQILEDIQINDLALSNHSDKDMLLGLKELIVELLAMTNDDLDKIVIMQRIKLITLNDEKYYEVFKFGLETDLSPEQLKRNIITTRRALTNLQRERKISNYLSQASYKVKHERSKIGDMNEFIVTLTSALEQLQTNNNEKDPSIIGDFNLSDQAGVVGVLNEIVANNDGSGILVTGWQALNKMLQGGFRRGQFSMIAALQHKYKTGFTLSILSQIAMYNKPYMKDETKKPLLLRISFEDNLTENYQFIYQYLKYSENREPVDVSKVEPEQMYEYIKSKLTATGYEIKLMRVDPTNWTYKHIVNKILELESQGYEVHLCMVDYLSMIPTKGCITSGPTGTDLRDMFRRIRNFMSSKNIAFITPHQLSTEAKELVRNGNTNFVKFIAEKGYYSGSKQLDQEVDLEIYIHIQSHEKEAYLTVQRGKHRIPTIISDDDKYFVLKFPKKNPIADDLTREDTSLRKVGGLPNEQSNGELFSKKPLDF